MTEPARRDKIGLYGGSFDPIHAGHVEPVLEARRQLGLDRVYYLPTARPPHKPGRQFATSHARLTMVELALLDRPDLMVLPVELTPGEIAYTIDSVEYFREAFPTDELTLLVGGDSFVHFTGWRRWRDILEQARLGVLVRPGWELERVRAELPEALAELAAAGGVDFVDNRPVEISSTGLRDGFARGELPPAGAMHPLVVEYIQKYSLYR